MELCQVQEVKKTYQQLDQFLNRLFASRPLVILSVLAKSTSENEGQGYRLAFNRQALRDCYSDGEIERILRQVYTRDGVVKGQIVLQTEKSAALVAFDCGVSGEQSLWGVFSSERKVSDVFIQALVSLMKNVSYSREHIRQLKELKSLVHIDDATGLYNYRKLLNDLDDAVVRHRETGEKFVVFFIDIDYFKKINDRYGHLVGTQILADMAVLFKKALRASDSVYRYGGDEFVMLLPDTDFAMAKNIGQRILQTVAQERFKIKENKKMPHTVAKLTVSMGVAEFPGDVRDQEEILSLADRMMYEAKKRGRQQICHAWDFFQQ